MIISRRRNFVFVHIPKTGGTSLSLRLEERAAKDDILLGDTPKALRRRRRQKELKASGRLWKHATLADIDGLVPAAELAEMFVFTLVRNPWDRLVSYHAWLRAQGFDHPAVRLAQRLGFADFLRHPETVAALLASPVSRYVTAASGDLHCNAFVRLEAFEADIAPVEAHLGFALSPLPKVNASEREADYRRYYDDALAEHVAALCPDEIARFGYAF